MRTARYIMMAAATCVLAALMVLAVVGAFKPSDEARAMFTSPPLTALWFALCGLLAAGFVVFGALRRRLGMAAMHAGCVLVIGGSMWGSPAGHELQRRLGADKTPRGHAILGGHADEAKTPLYDELLPMEVLEWLVSTGVVRWPEELPSHLDQLPLAMSMSLVDEGMLRPLAELPFELRLEGSHSEFYPVLVVNVFDPSTSSAAQQWLIGLAPSAPLKLPTTDITLQVLAVTPAIYDGGEVTQSPAVRLKLTRRGREETGTLRPAEGASRAILSLQAMYDSEEDWLAGNSPAIILFRPGPADAPRSFSADVSVYENDRQVAGGKISVNYPLHYGGYHIYSWTVGPGDPQVLVMAVSDSGWLAVWVGFVCLTGGAVWRFWLIPLWRAARSRTARRRAC